MANPAPAARAARTQATTRWPNRNQASDGIVPSAAHTAASPNSDHEIGEAGYNHAVDLTHDPASGCDCGKIADGMRLAKDSRIKYVIYNRRIFASYWRSYRRAWVWGPYSGSNPHTRHMHVSILDTKAACLDTSSWPGIAREEVEPVETYRIGWGEARTEAARVAIIERVASFDVNEAAIEWLGRAFTFWATLTATKNIEALIESLPDAKRGHAYPSDVTGRRPLADEPPHGRWTDDDAFGDDCAEALKAKDAVLREIEIAAGEAQG